jgi:hypothetical protein
MLPYRRILVLIHTMVLILPKQYTKGRQIHKKFGGL